MRNKNLTAQESTEETFRELGIIMGRNGKIRKKREVKYGKTKGNYGRIRDNTGKPLTSPRLPFRIPVIERTIRQAQSLQGYKASAYCLPTDLRSSSRLRIVVKRREVSLGGADRFLALQGETLQDYLGFAQASLTEVRGDIERLHTDGYLRVREAKGKYGRDYGNIRGGKLRQKI